MQIFYTIIVPFIISFIFLTILITFKNKININDIPNKRSLHSKPIPRTGGIGIVVSFLITSIFFLEDSLKPFIFLAIGVVFLLGLFDDIKPITPKTKFFIIFLSVLILFFDGLYLKSLGNYLGFDLSLGWFGLPFTIFAILGFTNALNLIDGVDGLAAGVSFVILLAFSYIGYQFHDPFIFMVSLILMGSIGAFIVFNWEPAKIFMGDSGSLTLGFVLSILAIASTQYIHPVVMLYFLAVPIIDTLVVMIRRISHNQSPFQADKTHIHHLMIDFFGSGKKTTIFLVMTQSIFCFLGYVVARHIELYPLGLFPIAMIISFIIITILAYMLFTTILKNKGTY